jgi:CopG family transcriptional regulator, nickel-responsive regulator
LQEKPHSQRPPKKRERVTRISMSLPTNLLLDFDNSMSKSGYTDRSKALQTAIHSFINNYEWEDGGNSEYGAGAIIMLYDNHAYNQDKKSIQIQHEYREVISATTHLHLDGDNCLETIMVTGKIKKIKDLAKSLSQNRGIKNLKVHFLSLS